jgi:hypothetical protein
MVGMNRELQNRYGHAAMVIKLFQSSSHITVGGHLEIAHININYIALGELYLLQAN